MANFFYTDANGQKQGPVNDQQLQALATQGTITPITPLVTEGGHKGTAGQIPGLQFNATAHSPFAQASPSTGQLFCTNCGCPVTGQAVACMSCGAKPVGHKKFCRHCGVALNPEQVICTKCGAAISAAGSSQFIGNAITEITSGGVSKAAIASLILGVMGLLFWLIPLFGLPITVSGLICGYFGTSKLGRGVAITGIVLCIIGLVLTIINAAIGAYPWRHRNHRRCRWQNRQTNKRQRR